MRCLLDTHTLLWTLFDEEKLSPKAATAIETPTNDVYVSVITYWEISLKYSLGKLELHGISPGDLPDKAMEAGLATLSITELQASTFHNLPKLKHKDPFDRLIIWQAIDQRLTLVTKDKEMRQYRKHGLAILW